MVTATAKRTRTSELPNPADVEAFRDLMKPLGPLFRLSEAPKTVREMRGNARVLIIDDFELTGLDLRDELSRVYGRVEYESDPREAVRKVVRAAEEGDPYSALVLDLRMPGMNGDRVARILARLHALPPAVVHSGDWSVGLRDNLAVQVDAVRSSEELKAAGDEAYRKLDGIPLLSVRKHAGDNPTQDVVDALDTVLLIAHRVDGEKFMDYARRFKPAVVEATPTRDYVEKLAEVVGLFGKRIRGWRRRLAEEYPGFTETVISERMDEALLELDGQEYSFEGLMEERDDLGAARRHGIPGQFGRILGAVERLEHEHERGRASDAVNALFQNPAFERDLRTIRQEVRDYLTLTSLVRPAREEATTFGVNLIGSFTRDFELHLAGDDPKIHASWPVFNAVVEQPILNAKKAVAGKPDGKVVVSTGRTRVGDINDAKARKYFEETHQLTADDHVAHVLVEDNGPGIPPENLPRITQLHYSTFGTEGFGLHYLDQTIGKINGTWSIDTQPGKGTRFHMYFKLAESSS